MNIRRPRPLPRQGRRLGPPEVWNLALGSQAKAHAIKATPLSATCPRHLHAPAELLHLHAPGRSRLPFARPQTLQTLPQASKATTLTATTCPCHLFFRGFKTAVCPPSNPQALPTLSQASKATTLTATCPCHLFFRGFKTAVCPPSNPPNASNAPAGLQGNNSYSYMSSNPPNASNPLAGLQGPAICFSGGSRLPFARPQTPQTLPTLPQASKATTLTATCPQTLQTLPTLSQASKATTLTATCPCHLFFTGFKTAVCPPSNPPNTSNALAGLQGNNSYSYMSDAPAGLQGNNSYSYMPLPSVFQGVQDCRLPALKPPKRFQRSRSPPRQQLLQLHVPAICFSGGSRLPLQAQLHAPAICFFRGFKTAVCPASNPPNASNAPAGLQGNNSYSYMPLPSVFQGVQDCRLPALKPPKRFQRSRRPPRQQLLQLHVPAICFSGGSRLPSQAKAHATFARPQTLQTLLHASKATTLTATTCPCHLFFRGFKASKATTLTATMSSNPPNASNPLAGL